MSLSSQFDSLVTRLFPDWPGSDPTIPEGSYTPIIVASFLFHWCLYYFSPVAPFMDELYQKSVFRTSNGPQWKEIRRVRSYFVSSVHASVCSIYVVVWIWLSGWKLSDLFDVQKNCLGGHKNTWDEYTWPLNSFTVGYFMYDFLYLVFLSPDFDIGSYVHHVVNGIGIFVGVWFGTARGWHFILLTAELSTPFLNAKYLWRYNHKLNEVCNYLFVLFFFCARIILGTYITYSVFVILPDFFDNPLIAQYHKRIMFVQIPLYSLSVLLNYYCFVLIINKIIKKFKKSEKVEVAKKSS